MFVCLCVSLCLRQRVCLCVTVQCIHVFAGACHAVHCKVAAPRVPCVRRFTRPTCPSCPTCFTCPQSMTHVAESRPCKVSTRGHAHASDSSLLSFPSWFAARHHCARPLTKMSLTTTSMERSVAALQMHAHSMSVSTALSQREIIRMKQAGSSIFISAINQLLVNSVDENRPCTTLTADAIHQVVYPICRAAAVVCAAYFSDVAWAFRANGWTVTKLPCGALTFEAAPAAAVPAPAAPATAVPAAVPAVAVPAAAQAPAVPAAAVPEGSQQCRVHCRVVTCASASASARLLPTNSKRCKADNGMHVPPACQSGRHRPMPQQTQ